MSAKRAKVVPAAKESRKTRASTRRDQAVGVVAGAARRGLLRLPAALVAWLASWLQLPEIARLAASCSSARRCVSLRLGDPTPMLGNLATLEVPKALSATRLQALLARCTSLKRLVCTQQLLPTAALEALTAHTRTAATLTELHCRLEINNRRNMAALARLTALRALTWCASRANQLCPLPVLPQLTSLTCACDHDPASLTGLLRCAPHLHTLHLAPFVGGAGLVTGLGVLTPLLPRLGTLSVGCYPYTWMFDKLVSAVNRLAGLHTLELWVDQELDLRALALPALTSLRLWRQAVVWPARGACALVRSVEMSWLGDQQCIQQLFATWPLVEFELHCRSTNYCGDLLAAELLELLAEPDFPSAYLRTCRYQVCFDDMDAETSADYTRALDALKRARPELRFTAVLISAAQTLEYAHQRWFR